MVIEQPSCWILSDGTIGMEVQCIALAEALGFQYDKKHIKPYWLNRIFPSLAQLPGIPLATNFKQVTSQSSPDILITCGRRHAGASIALKRLSKGTTYTIHIQDPKINSKHFDLLIIPEHDRPRAPNIILSNGSLTRITQALLDKEAQLIKQEVTSLIGKKIAVNIGGDTKDNKVDDETIQKLILSLNQFSADYECSLMITTTNRTSEPLKKALTSLTENPNIILWTGGSRNPYAGFLGVADAIIVTSDSINMISEACSTGKPVNIFPLGKNSKKREKFIGSLEKMGLVKYFNGEYRSWGYEPLNETARIANLINIKLKEKEIIQNAVDTELGRCP